MDVIPRSDHRLILSVFIAQDTDAGGAQEKIARCSRPQPQPPGGKHAQNVAARKEQHISVDLPHSSHHRIGTSADLFGRFSAWATITKQAPVRPFLMYLD